MPRNPTKPPPRADSTFSAFDLRCMRRALTLARRGEERVEPNPMVGCVIARGERILGEGHHRRFGGAHAEIEAILAAGGESAVRGATFYVTLEPCSITGKTPPCVDALLRCGAARVVAATLDPNPRVNGEGLRRLAASGVRVQCGLCESEARALIAPFEKFITRREPWVIAKWAQSLDGKIATRTGDSKWISDETARRHAHAVRGRVDAIIIGAGTAVRDDPLLTCRDAAPRRTAARVVLDSRLRLPVSAAMVCTANETPTWVFCTAAAPATKRRRLEQLGCVVTPIRSIRGGLDLSTMLRELAARGAANVIVEGGGRLLGQFFDERRIDEVHIYLAPRLIGGADAIGPLHGAGASTVAGGVDLSGRAKLRALGNGWLLQTRLQNA